MLTRDLVRARVRGREIGPSLVAVPRYREAAVELLDILAEAEAGRWRRARVEEALGDLVGDRQDHKVIRGLAKVALDRCDFEVQSPVDPPELRRRVFLAARRAGPLALEPGPLGRPVARDVLEAVGRELDLTADQVAGALYADLREEQRLLGSRVPDDPDWLVDRYNLALVQALLLRALEVEVVLDRPTPARLRQLLRHAKFHQLLLRAARQGDRVRLVLDGPTSLLRQSTRYGRQLATFFPAVLLQECPWEVRATVLWTRARHRKELRLDHRAGLRGHYADTGGYTSREARWFAERFAALDSPWALSDRVEPLDLGGRGLVLPDFRLERDGRVAWLDIVGYWRRDWLERRLRGLREHGPGNLVLAVSRNLSAGRDAALEGFPGEVIEFARIVPARRVEEAAERVAR